MKLADAVLGLVWKEADDGSYVAKAAIGEYRVGSVEMQRGLPMRALRFNGEFLKRYFTLEAAQQAAQDHYNESIKAAGGVGVKNNQFETSRSIDKRKRREHLRCPICPPNRGENATRKPKHGVKKLNKRRRVRVTIEEISEAGDE